MQEDDPEEAEKNRDSPQKPMTMEELYAMRMEIIPQLLSVYNVIFSFNIDEAVF